LAVARYSDPSRELGTVKPDTSEAARRRRDQARRNEVRERAQWLLDNDPDINDMVSARREAARQIKEIEEYDARVRKGLVDPESGELTPEGRRRLKKDDEQKTKPSGVRRTSGRATSRRPARVTNRFVRKTARTITAPFGSAASAGWTFIQAGLSLVLLYVVLRDADAITDVTKAITAGIRNFRDPRVPLFPTKGETAPVRRRVTHRGPPTRVGRRYHGSTYIRGGRSGA